MKTQFWIFVILLVFTACKRWQHKYPEDTERTKLTPNERITNKWWTLESAFVNNIDYTDSIDELFGKYQIYFSSNVYQTSQEGFDVYYGTVTTEKEPTFTTAWSFPDQESIGLGAMNGNNSGKYSIVPGYLQGVYLKYTILKLSPSELKIKIYWGNGYTITNYFKTF